MSYKATNWPKRCGSRKESPVPPSRRFGIGLTSLSFKKSFVTETQTRKTILHSLGDAGEPSAEGSMKTGGQSRKDATGQTPPTSNKSLRIGSWNVRTMYETGKTAQIVEEMRRYQLHILGLSETHWIQCGQKRTGSGELIIYSGAEDGPHRNGVAMVLSKATQKSLRGWEALGPRMIMASFTTKNKKINMNVIQVYAPTNAATEEDKDHFYNQLYNVMEKLPSKDVNILMGDLNAQLGKDNTDFELVMGKHGLGELTDNGDRLRDLCAFNSLRNNISTQKDS